PVTVRSRGWPPGLISPVATVRDRGEDPVSCIADDVADATALTVALMHGDVEAVETLLRFGDAAGIALVCAGRLAAALGRVDTESAAVILDGWRRDAESRRRCAS